MSVGFDFQGEPPPVRHAATVIVLRPGPDRSPPEIFFVRRSADVRFMGGAYVFPGGRLDPGDAAPEVPCDLSPDDAAARLGLTDPLHARALFIAAARECLEESGILLSHAPVTPDVLAALRAALSQKSPPPIASVLGPHAVSLSLDALTPFARWVTPAVETRRFDATFFLARAPEGSADATHDGGETDASVWQTAAEAIARAARREIILAPPTHRVLEILALASTVDEAFALAPSAPLDPIEPGVAVLDGAIHVILPDDPLHPLHAAGPQPRMASRPLDPMPTRFRYDDGVWIPS